jgi:predicted PurR-regulated permease PerM
VLTPVVVFLAQRTGWPRRLWAVLFYLLLLGLLIWGLVALAPVLTQQFTELINELPGHVRTAGRALQAQGFLSADSSIIDVLGARIDLNASDQEIKNQLSLIITEQVGRSALPVLAHGFEGILKLLVYLVSTFFLLLEMDRIGDGIARLTPTPVRLELGPWVRRINHVLGAYIRGQLILVVLMSVTTFIGLSLLEVRYAPLLAIFTGLVETMPFVGPYIAGGTAVLVALTQGTAPFGWEPMWLAIAVAVMYTILRQLEDNFVMPFLIGRLVHLHPLVVIFSVLAGAALGGILGLLLAVPVAATLKIIGIYLNGKLREEPLRTLVVLEPNNDWDTITNRVRQAVVLSKFNGAGRPYLLLSAENPPRVLLDPDQFQRLRSLLDESRANVVILTSLPALAQLAEEAGIPVETKAESPSTVVSAPPPDFEEERPTGILNRLRRDQDEEESLENGAGTEKSHSERRLFTTRPLSRPKDVDEERPV